MTDFLKARRAGRTSMILRAPGSGYPTSYEDIRGIARDPEWQCRVAELKRSTFNEMPIHCKKAALAHKNFSLPAALAESDPKRVAQLSLKLIDSPIPKFHLPDGGSSPSNLVMAFASKATDKSSTKEDEGGCDWDKDGTDDCATTITNPGPDPIDGLASADASVSGAVSLARQTQHLVVTHMLSEQSLANRILDIVYFARDSAACTDAFKAAGVTPVAEQVKNLRIVTQDVFSDSSYDDMWAPDKQFANDIREALADYTTWANGVTTNDLTYPGQRRNGWRYIGLTSRGIRELDHSLAKTVIHSLVHSGGDPGKNDQTWWEWTWGIKPHDLRHLGEKYDDIIKKCIR